MRLTLFFFVSVIVLLAPGERTFSQDDRSPYLSVEQVIKKARRYAADKDIDLKGKFISKIEYRTSSGNTPYWSVIRLNKNVTKGGEVELRLYADGPTKEIYHK